MGILHVCGGDPLPHLDYFGGVQYSPRVWRWSCVPPLYDHKRAVFSTCVEVILSRRPSESSKTRILHVCGGDPSKLLWSNIVLWYSPRVWRWSCFSNNMYCTAWVFSTCVEVILAYLRSLAQGHRILHVCGGDPYNIRSLIKLRWYSPRVWRWSYGWNHQKRSLEVFSTCVEVIPL